MDYLGAIRKMRSLINIFPGLEDKEITFIYKQDEEISISYAELFRTAQKRLYSLQQKGIKQGNEVIFQLEDPREFIVAFWACIIGGIIPVPVTVGKNDEHKLKLIKIWNVLKNPYLLSSENILERLEDSSLQEKYTEVLAQIQARTVLVAELADTVGQGVIYNSSPEDIAFIQFSSGSTGDPKGVVLTHQNLLTDLDGMINASTLDHTDELLSWMPLTHDMGLIGFHLTPLFAGCNQHIMPTELFIRNPVLWMHKAHEHRATFLSSPNFGYEHFLKFYKPEKGNHWDLSSVRLIFNGAEPISASLCTEFLTAMSRHGLRQNTMFPCYGMAEACLAVTMPPVGEEFRKVGLHRQKITFGQEVQDTELTDEDGVVFVDVGFPVKGCNVRICLQDDEPVGDNIIGCIKIKGDNVTEGYYNNPAATEKAISKDGWLNTGDYGFMRNGRLVITGRAKDIIFVNGQNFYPHDIERIAEGVEGIELNKIAVCAARKSGDKYDRIICFIIYKRKLEEFVHLAGELKRYINRRVGLELDEVIPVRSIPKTTSGKIQRYLLSQQYTNGDFDSIIGELRAYKEIEQAARELGQPVNQIEQRLLECCKEVLQSEKIGTKDDLLELGINSLKAAILIGKIAEEFGVELPISEILGKPTIEEIARFLLSAEKSVAAGIEPVRLEREYYPLSCAQKRLYALHEMEAESTRYNLPYMLMADEKFEPTRFEWTVNELVRRHEALRTCFEVIDGEVRQRVHKQLEVQVVHYEVEEKDIERVVQNFVQPFDLRIAPLYRVGLVKYDRKYLLMFDMHHIISDGASMGIMEKEFASLYLGEALPEVRIQYKDYAIWQNDFLASKQFEDKEKFWLEYLKGEIPALDLPTDYVRPSNKSSEGDVFQFLVGKELRDKLNQLAVKRGATLYMVLLAAYNVWLGKYTGQEDIIVGSPISGRRDRGLDSTIGMFVNTLTMRNYPAPDKAFNEFLAEVKGNCLKAYENQDYPFDLLAEKLELIRDLSRNALFDTMFALQDVSHKPISLGDMVLQPYNFINKSSKVDLILETVDDVTEIKCRIEYCTRLFKKESIVRMGEHFCNLLTRLVESPDVPISMLKMISLEEEQTLLHTFNDNWTDYPRQRPLHELFEEQVERNPNQEIVFDSQKLSYLELNVRANQLARAILANGVQGNEIVGLLVERSLDMVVGIMGILKAGAAYLPIDIEYPQERITYMLEDCSVKLLLGQKHLTDRLQYSGTVINLDTVNLNEYEVENLQQKICSNGLVYIIYTSGTTGNPKGVMTNHFNISRVVKNTNYIEIRPDDVLLQLSNYAFDGSTFDIFGALLNGAKLVLVKKEMVMDPHRLSELIKNEEITVFFITTALFNVLVDTGIECFKGIRKVLFGGERVSIKHVEKALNYLGKNHIVHVYGPTETTVFATAYPVDIIEENSTTIPIGAPIANTQIYIFDRNNCIQPVGVIGEICIAGDGLAAGYLGKRVLTEEKFVENPLSPGQFMYRTGDLGRWRSDGTIEFVGRTDHQVKIRGFRIELGEIENRLLSYEGIKEARVVERIDHNSNKYLCAYLVAAAEIPTPELKAYLAEKLPYYAIPPYFVHLEKMPLTMNGKINLKALPEPDFQVETGVVYVAPASEAEERMARIWSEVLGIEQVGVNDNFFELGGDSIKAIQILARAKQFDINISAKDIFSYQTIGKILSQVDYQNQGQAICQDAVEGEVPLAPIQLWYFSGQNSRPHYWFQSNLFKLKESVDVGRLEKALQKIIEHHDALRMGYKFAEDTVLQFNRSIGEVDFKLDVFALAEYSYDKQIEMLQEIARKIMDSHDLQNCLPIKGALFDLGVQGKRLFIAVHHLVVDGLSWRILLEDLEYLYRTSLQGTLPLKSTSFQEWSRRLREYAVHEALDVSYWKRNEFRQAESLTTQKIENNYFRDFAEIAVELAPEMTESLLTRVNAAYNTEINDILLSAVSLACQKTWKMSNILLTLEGHGREEIFKGVDLSRTVGWFTSTYPVYIKTQENIEKTIIHVKENLRKIPNNGLNFGIAQYLQRDEKLIGIRPQITFNYLGQFDNVFVKNGLLSLCSEKTGPAIHELNQQDSLLEINCMVREGRLVIFIGYNQRYLPSGEVEQFANSYRAKLEEILRHVANKEGKIYTASDFEMEDEFDEDDFQKLAELYSLEN